MKNVNPFPEPVYITQPLLPEISDVSEMLSKIWSSRHITNNGNMAIALEKELAAYLGVKCLSLFSNGTIALQVACKALRLSGQVITTPFTFAATVHTLHWCGIKPIFCDVEEDTLNINPDRIEQMITPDTTAIMPVHVFGNPCKVEEIEQIARKHGLRVIYDAAHTFGVKVKDKPIGTFGDISMFSFHATKVYHTVEGGALTCNEPYTKERIDSLRNFGIRGGDNVLEPGTNGKLNEIQAAIGLLVLELVDEEIEKRRAVTEIYREMLKDLPGLRLFHDMEGVKHNYPYFVIRVDSDVFGLSRDELYEGLKEYNVFSRRYFYPLCSQFPCYRDLPSAAGENLRVAEEAVGQVLALPLHGRMAREEVEKICEIIKYIRDTH